MKLRNLINVVLLCGGMGLPLTAIAKNSGMPAMPVQLSEHDDMAKKKELVQIRKKYPLPLPKANAGEVKAAMGKIADYSLKRESAQRVVGTVFPDKSAIKIQQQREMTGLVRALAFAASKGDEAAKESLYLYLDYLFTENIFETMPKLMYNSYADVRKLPEELLSALPVCDDARKKRLIEGVEHLLEADQMYLSREELAKQANSDYIYNVTPHLFACAVYHPDDEQAIKGLSAFSHFLSASAQYTSGGKDILKPDGTGFHHWTHYNGYMYAYRTWVEYIHRLKGTSFRIDKEAYEHLRKAVVSLYLMAVRSASDDDRLFGNSMAGRHPFTGMNANFQKKQFENLIEIGGDMLGMSYDKELASCYNYFYKTRKYDAPEWNPNGFYQFNYSPAGVYRHDGWVAVMRCPTTNFWGAEIYNKTNRFGRYQSHGTLEVIYEGGLSKNGYPADKEAGGAGWDWNMMPGSTTVHYTDWKQMTPNGNDADRFDQKSQTTNFAGALAWEDCGIFAAAFDQGDNWGSRRFEPTNLKFCKSVFAIDGLLYSLGTGISAKGAYSDEWITATNLFQNIISSDCGTLIVDGKEVSGGSNVVIEPSKSTWIVAPATTGYFIPKGHDQLVVRLGEQASLSSLGLAAKTGMEVAAKAYLHHGVKPEKKSYQFMVVPGTTSEQMKVLAKKQEKEELFKVLALQDSLHILKHLPSATTAYAVFAPVQNLSYGMLRASETELLVMERLDKSGKKLNLALCNPNLRPVKEGKDWLPTPTKVSIELKGVWKAEGNAENVTLEKNSSGNTILKTTLSEGNPMYVALVAGK